jgi:hypothetical protein
MSTCSKHKKELLGVSDMKALAQMVGDLHYETLKDFIHELSKKLNDDAMQDFQNGRTRLSSRLLGASVTLRAVYQWLKEAWSISEPYMDSDKNT